MNRRAFLKGLLASTALVPVVGAGRAALEPSWLLEGQLGRWEGVRIIGTRWHKSDLFGAYVLEAPVYREAQRMANRETLDRVRNAARVVLGVDHAGPDGDYTAVLVEAPRLDATTEIRDREVELLMFTETQDPERW